MSLTITLDRAAGVAVLAKGGWRHRLALEDLRHWRDLYSKLWGRGAKRPGAPGPWASFYDDDLRRLTAAVQEADHG